MKEYLDQLGLNPMQRVDFENFIYGQADRMVEGYRGGMWECQKVGDAWILVIPGKPEQPVTLNNYAFGGSMTTDRITASAAFSSIVSNWYVGLRHEQGRITDEALDGSAEFSSKLYHAGKDLPNPQAFYRFID